MRIIQAMSAARAAFSSVLRSAPAKSAETTGSSAAAKKVSNHTYVTSHATYGTGLRTTATYLPMRELREARLMDRREAIKSSRFLRNRLGLVKALFENSARHAVAGGLSPTTQSGDTDYDLYTDELFDSVANRRTFDIREDHTFYGMQPMLLADMMCDGDCGGAKVRDENGEPRVQLFPSEALGDAGVGGSGWKDGIQRDITGRPLRYRILKDTLPGAIAAGPRYWDYPAAQFLHIARFDRININRPMPWLTHGKESCLDILDQTALEKAVRKINSYIAAAITTPTGEAPVGFEDALTDEQDSVTTEKRDGTTPQKNVTRTYADFLGGAAIPVLQDGEKFEFFQNSRTSMTTTDFIDWLVGDIAIGFGVRREFVWSVLGMSGPNTRLILQQTDWFFQHLQEVLISCFCQPVWESIVADALNRGKLKLPKKAGANWRNVHWQGPQSMSIDKGRDGQLFETLIRSGMLSRSEWHEMSGKAGRRQRFRIMDELAEDIAYCQGKQIPLELYFGTHPGQLVTQPGKNTNDPEAIAEAVINMMRSQKLGR